MRYVCLKNGIPSSDTFRRVFTLLDPDKIEHLLRTHAAEIVAIPLLLESLNLKGNTVTIDAAGCQKSIVAQVTEKKGHYVLGLKRNHLKLYKAVEEYILREGESAANRLYDAYYDSHGRSVRRRCFGYDITALPEVSEWSGAKTVVAVETISSKNNDLKRGSSSQWRYFLSNHASSHKRLPAYIRNHWSIENKLHWVLDVNMKEDDDQKSERKSVLVKI